MADAGTLTEQERHVLRQYGRGDDLGDIATRLGETRERVGQIAIRLCNLNRNRARELSRDAPPARPLRPTRPDRDADPAELDRVDQAFAGVFARKSPQLAVLVDAARALSVAASRELYPGCPMEVQIRDVDLAVATLDGADRKDVAPQQDSFPAGDDHRSGQPATSQADHGPRPPAAADDHGTVPEPLERWSAHRCADCRWIGPFIDRDEHTDCPGQPQPVTLLVMPREQPCQP